MKNYFKQKKLLILFLFLSIAKFDFSQTALLKKANDLYDSKSYMQAIDSYEKILKKNPSNLDVIPKIANSYRLVNNTTGAEKYYAKLVTLSNSQPIDKYYYGQILLQKEKYQEASAWLALYTQDERGEIAAKSIEDKQKFYKDVAFYKISKLDVNSECNDFSPAFYKSGIVFSSSRNKSSLVKRNHSWTNNNFTKLYFTAKDSATKKYSTPFLFARRIKSKFNDGPASFSAKQDIIYFTRNNIENRKVKTSSDGFVKLKIFQSESLAQQPNFENTKFFTYNSDEYNCAHPATTADGNKLYFASDMPGGLGGMDLYVCTLEGGIWGKPTNLGESINTKGNELFPFIAEDGTIYFSSNGKAGLGGLDVYTTHFNNGKFSTPENIGSPINSGADDFGFIVNKEGNSGYFSSNRDNFNMNDDLYEFESTKPKKIQVVITVIDAIESKNINTSYLNITDSSTHVGSSYNSTNGVFTLELEPEKIYTIEASADSYYSNLIPKEIELGNPNFSITLEKVIKLNIVVYNNPKDRKPAKAAMVNVKGIKGEPFNGNTDNYGKISNIELLQDNNYEITARVNVNNSAPVMVTTIGLKNTKTIDQTIFIENTGAICVYGSIADASANNAKVEGATITIKNVTSGEKIYETITQIGGRFKNCALQAGKKYSITVSKEGYFTKSEELSTMGVKTGNITKQDLDFEKSFSLEKIVVGKAVKIDNIYFDSGKWNIRKDAAPELDKIAKLMVENPQIIIELGSHTDCRSASTANMELSEKRAKSSVDYILSKGIVQNRISGKGYGETILLNKCECEGEKKVPCTDKEHQQNRRTEFKVVGFLQKDGTVVKPTEEN